MSNKATSKSIPYDDHSGAPKPKRIKVTIACEECRTKKIKCDGVRPICQPCMKKYGQNAHCDWSVSTGRGGGISRDYIMQLEDRIRELEHASTGNSITIPQSPTRLSHQQPSQSLPTTNIGSAVYEKSLDPSSTQSYASNMIWSNEVSNTGLKSGLPTTNYSSQQTSLDGQTAGLSRLRDDPIVQQKPIIRPLRSSGHVGVVSAMMGAVLDEPQSQEFFGRSSAGSFIKQVRKAIDGKIESPQCVEPADSILDRVQMSMLTVNGESQQQSNLNYVLPPRDVADSLLAIYWKIVYPLYPYLDRYEIETGYQSLWTGQGLVPYDKPMFLCMLNIIFALSCQLSDAIKPEQREASADVFIVRARETLNLNMWQVGSLQSVQALLLLSQYLQTTNDPHQCWIMVGMAVRSAQGLGLHLPEMSEQVSSSRARELLRKVWHACVLMDLFVSMTYGRPAMIDQNVADAVPLPMAIDEQFLSRDTQSIDSQPEDQPSILDFFIQSLGLYRILRSILLSVYTSCSSDNASIDSYEAFFGPEYKNGSSFIDLDRALSMWERRLPRHLIQESDDEIHLRQAVILRQRFLHVKVLLLRPILSRFVTSIDSDSDSDSPALTTTTLPYRVALQCSIMCVQTAQEAISHIHTRLPSDPNAIGPLAAWWFNVLFVYTAATVLVAARLRPAITAEVPDSAIHASWAAAIDILRRYEAFSASSAQRIVLTLQLLFDKVPEKYEQHRTQLTQTQNRYRRPSSAISQEEQQQDSMAMLSTLGHGSSLETMPGGGAGWSAASPWLQSSVGGPATQQQQQQASQQTTTAVDNGMAFFDDLEFDFDINDVSWLNSVPFYQT